MHLYWEQNVFDEYELVKYSIYIMDVYIGFRDFIKKFINIGGHMLLFRILTSKKSYLIWNILQQIWLVERSCSNLLKWLNVNRQQTPRLQFMITKTKNRKQLV